MKLKNSILPVWTLMLYKIINYKWVMNFIAFCVVYWFVKWCCAQINRQTLLKPMILSEDEAFIMWNYDFELSLKAINPEYRDKQIKELIKIFEFNILSEEMKNSSNRVVKDYSSCSCNTVQSK
jgi:hypothetical protein